MTIDIAEIQRYLPHRYPFLLIDKIVEIEPGKRVVGIKNVTYNEFFFMGHFPGRPIMPGVLVIEALAQAGGYLALAHMEHPGAQRAYFLGIDKAKFRKPVVPGDVLRLEVEITRQRGYIFRFKGKAFVESSLVAEAELQSMVVVE